MAAIQRNDHAHCTRVWILICEDGTLGGTVDEPSAVKPRDLVMTLEAVLRTQVPMLRVTHQVLLRGATLEFIALLTYNSYHEFTILETLSWKVFVKGSWLLHCSMHDSTAASSECGFVVRQVFS